MDVLVTTIEAETAERARLLAKPRSDQPQDRAEPLQDDERAPRVSVAGRPGGHGTETSCARAVPGPGRPRARGEKRRALQRPGRAEAEVVGAGGGGVVVAKRRAAVVQVEAPVTFTLFCDRYASVAGAWSDPGPSAASASAPNVRAVTATSKTPSDPCLPGLLDPIIFSLAERFLRLPERCILLRPVGIIGLTLAMSAGAEQARDHASSRVPPRGGVYLACELRWEGQPPPVQRPGGAPDPPVPRPSHPGRDNIPSSSGKVFRRLRHSRCLGLVVEGDRHSPLHDDAVLDVIWLGNETKFGRVANRALADPSPSAGQPLSSSACSEPLPRGARDAANTIPRRFPGRCVMAFALLLYRVNPDQSRTDRRAVFRVNRKRRLSEAAQTS